MSQATPRRLILASTSLSRRTLLANAGLDFDCEAPGVDEASVKSTILGAPPVEIAKRLAAEKSLAVSRKNSDALVLGADQTLELAGASFDKPESLQAARLQLATLRGRTHFLHSALCLSANGKTVWDYCGTASLRMRSFSESELEAYLVSAGVEVLQSVGAYQIEGPAIQLFESIEGDYFTILGLPLLPLLTFLRKHGELAK